MVSGSSSRSRKVASSNSDVSSDDEKTALVAKRDPIGQAILLTLPPGDQNSLRTSAFVRILDVKDVRYDIRCYGHFFDDLPRRLGKNHVLDKAVDAMVASFPYATHQQDTVAALGKYGKAIKALRESLLNATEPCSLDTLGAIYIIMLCQVS